MDTTPETAEVAVEVPAKFASIVESIEKMTVLELNELVKIFEKKFGVSAAAVAAVVPSLPLPPVRKPAPPPPPGT